jgi:hypothetical protein
MLQPGLAGVDLGALMLKQVVESLMAEFPQLEHFSTLSPVPGFAGWLALQLSKVLGPGAAQAGPGAQPGSLAATMAARVAAAAGGGPSTPLLQQGEVDALLGLRLTLLQQGVLPQELQGGSEEGGRPAGKLAAGGMGDGCLPPSLEPTDHYAHPQPTSPTSTPPPTHPHAGEEDMPYVSALRLLQWLLQDSRWVGLPATETALRPLLVRLCAAYLYRERRRSSALDPVAHFHLRNGALLWRINWRADLSAEGLRRSHGLMVSGGRAGERVGEAGPARSAGRRAARRPVCCAAQGGQLCCAVHLVVWRAWLPRTRPALGLWGGASSPPPRPARPRRAGQLQVRAAARAREQPRVPGGPGGGGVAAGQGAAGLLAALLAGLLAGWLAGRQAGRQAGRAGAGRSCSGAPQRRPRC